jgi:hypothetical protein
MQLSLKNSSETEKVWIGKILSVSKQSEVEQLKLKKKHLVKEKKFKIEKKLNKSSNKFVKLKNCLVWTNFVIERK